MGSVPVSPFPAVPAIAGLPGVTKRIKTGDLLHLDANTGELTRVR